MIRSMTGFASASGSLLPHTWDWEVRAVNGKGLDIRVRVPDWVEGLEAGLRKLLSAQVKRGNVTLSLRLSRSEQDGALQINAAQLSSVLTAMATIETRAAEAGVTLAPSTAAEIVGLRGVLETSTSEDDTTALAKLLMAEAETLVTSFNAMRDGEGAALRKVLLGQLDELAALTAEAGDLAEARQATLAETLKRNLAKVMDNTENADPDRIAQELALIAVKSDVTEEIDRLTVHITAARALIDGEGPVGRKLDFLMQEFNREANTLCSKAQSTDLTRCGLALKTIIDQMREQVQNVE